MIFISIIDLLPVFSQLLKTTAGTCCVGNTLTMADCCLVPQVISFRGGFKTISIPGLQRPTLFCGHDCIPSHNQAQLKPKVIGNIEIIKIIWIQSNSIQSWSAVRGESLRQLILPCSLTVRPTSSREQTDPSRTERHTNRQDRQTRQYRPILPWSLTVRSTSSREQTDFPALCFSPYFSLILQYWSWRSWQ